MSLCQPPPYYEKSDEFEFGGFGSAYGAFKKKNNFNHNDSRIIEAEIRSNKIIQHSAIVGTGGGLSGAAAGGGTGAIIGAIVGSVVPGPGTVIGTLIGSGIGAAVGGSGGGGIGTLIGFFLGKRK